MLLADVFPGQFCCQPFELLVELFAVDGVEVLRGWLLGLGSGWVLARRGVHYCATEVII